MAKLLSSNVWMFMCGALCLAVGVGCTAGSAQIDRVDWEKARLVDLTHSFGTNTIVWPTEQDFRLITVSYTHLTLPTTPYV